MPYSFLKYFFSTPTSANLKPNTMKHKRGYMAQPEWFIILVPVLLLVAEPLGLKNLDFVLFLLILICTQKAFDKDGHEIPIVPEGKFWKMLYKPSKAILIFGACLCLFEGWISKLGRYLIETYT